MKIKKSWYLVIIVLYWMAVCTLLSQKIELEMRTEVIVKKCIGSRLSNSELVNKSAVFADGRSKIFELREGNGWDAGKTLAAEYTGNWMLDIDSGMVKLENIKNRTVILSASRIPKPGDSVQVITETAIGEDDYLIIYPDGIPNFEEPLPGDILARNDGALFIHVPYSVSPFMEHSAMNSLSAIQAPGWHIYSMADIQKFQSSIPLVIIILAVLAVPFILFGIGIFTDSFRTGKALAQQLCVAVAAILCVNTMLGFIDLPASILPEYCILDFGHYIELMMQIKEILVSLGVTL